MKKFFSLFLAIMMIFSVSVNAKTLEFTMGKKTVYESDKTIESFEIENAPYTKNSRTMVPVRVISEKFGANVEWIEASSQVVITTPEKSISLTLGSSEAVVNGEKITLDAAPEEFNGRTMVPLRFISETLGMAVDYVSATEQILITDNDVIMSIGETNIYYDDFLAALTLLGYNLEQHYVLGDGVDFASDALISMYGTENHLNSLGVFPLKVYSDEVSDFVYSLEDELRKTTLIAPVAKLLESDCFITDYVYSCANTDDVSDKMVAIYEDEFVTAKHILFLNDNTSSEDAKSKAFDTLKKIKSGADFDSLMNELSEDPGLEIYPNGYTFTKGEMVPEFEKAVFSLEEGQMSEVIETSYGYHIIKREPLEAFNPELASYILEILINRVYNQTIEEAKQNIDCNFYYTREEIINLMKK